MNIFSCQVMIMEKLSYGIFVQHNAFLKPSNKQTLLPDWDSTQLIPISWQAVLMVQLLFMTLKKVTTLKINCMLFLTVSMSSLMVCKLWKMENILFVHPVKAALSFTRGRTSTIIVTEFKGFLVLLIVFLKLIKILYFQDQKMVL